MGGVTDFLMKTTALGAAGKALGGNDDAQKALALQQQQLAQQKIAEEAKEAKMQRERMADMKARVAGGFGDAGGNNDATG